MATLDFKGKALVQNYHLTVKYHELVPKRDKSLTDKVRLDDNLIIHGDNLKALKALLPTYAGKVKCIYIDPPYNTGSEGWSYNDNVNSPMLQEWLGKIVDGEDLTRHDKWLCMITPRLKLLKELLREDGVIFISIDDHEAHRLRSALDEIVGNENFVATAIWQKKYAPQPDEKGLSATHEYLLIYSRTPEGWRPNLLARTEEAIARYKNPDNDPRGLWKNGDLSTKTKAAGHSYPIKGPSGKIHHPPAGRQWGPSKETFERMLAEKRIYFGPSGENVPSLKQFLSEVQQGTVPVTLWLREMVGDNQEAARELREIGLEFESPKPSRLVEHVLKMATSDNGNDIVLDSFSGSGVTAHAVLTLNKEDSGNRKFILVECEDYADSITAERVRRVIKGVKGASDENLKKGLPASGVDARRGQYRLFELPGVRLQLAREIIRAKIHNQRVMLMRNGDVPDRVTSLMAGFRDATDSARDMTALLGIEGTAAALYFEQFESMLKQREDWKFDWRGRNRRPPRDPVNALLSLGYSMLAKELTGVCYSVGLDPFLGFMHQPRYGRPALALDLMEEFRPLIADSVEISLINRGELGPEDFIKSANGMFLTDKGRRPFWEAWFRRLDTEVSHPEFSYKMAYRRMLEVQARQLWRFVRGEALTYHGFVTR